MDTGCIGYRLRRLSSSKRIKLATKVRPSRTKGREGRLKISVVRPKIPQAKSNQDEALTSPRPVLWIPKDELGVADNEISDTRKTYNSIWISNEGASLDARGKLKVWGDLPTLLDRDCRSM